MRLIINSSKLYSTDENKIRFYLPFTLEIHEFHLINCSIPYSFYNINRNNNEIKFNNTILTIPQKQYNAIQLRNILQSLLDITVTFDRQSLKFIFSSNNPFSINPLNLRYILGMQKQELYIAELVDGKYTTSSDCACDMTNRIHNIYIKSNIAPPNIFENEVEGNQILYRIPITSQFGSMIYYQNNSNNLNAEINHSLSMIEIQLTDSFNNPLDFNGLSYQIEFYMRTSDDEEILRNYNRFLMGGTQITTDN